jgi:hypothetical protein
MKVYVFKKDLFNFCISSESILPPPPPRPTNYKWSSEVIPLGSNVRGLSFKLM